MVLNPQNGQVLAMASYPSYNLNQWVGGISQADLNAIEASGGLNDYAIQGLYTPGSTFKLATATAALNSGVISATQYVNDTGIFTVPGCTGAGAGCSFHDDEAVGAGEVDMSKAITISDDFYFYNLGYLFAVADPPNGSGPQPIQDTAAAYGLGEPTGIDLPGESTGRVDSPTVRKQLHAANPTAFPNANWYVGDNIEMAFGQGGTVITPHLPGGRLRHLRQRRDPLRTAGGRGHGRARPARWFPSSPPRSPATSTCRPSVYQPILQGLEGVISNPSGTAYGAFQGFPLQQFPLAGKTGTASNAPSLEPNSWFVAFGPVPNPQYVVAVVIDQGGYGATAAAPVVRNAFDYLVTNPISPSLTLPTATNQPSSTPPTNNPPAGAPTTTTSSTTTTTSPSARPKATGAPGTGSSSTTTTARGGG